MPQISHGYAIGRVRVLEKNLLKQSALDRLAALETAEEVARALTELEWGEARTKRDVERLADQHVRAACQLLREVSPEPELTNMLLYKYDMLNLKVLIKARMLSETVDGVSDLGVLPIELLRRSVDERNYGSLPKEFALLMNEIEKHIALNPDPLYVDARIDIFYGQMVAESARKTKNAVMKAYFETWADMTNLIIALRCALMGKGSALAKELLIPGGTLPLEALLKIADEPERALNAMTGKPYAPALRGALQAPTLGAQIVALERQRDNYLLSLIRPHRYEQMSILPLIGYILAREREAASVRMIVTAKAARVSGDALRMRLRELYA